MAELKEIKDGETIFLFELTEKEVRDVVDQLGPLPPLGRSFEVFSVFKAALRSP